MLQGADVKYIDPSYMIRSVPCISGDRIYCKILAHNAVHCAFAGYTGVTVGLVNTHYVYLPIPVVISAPRQVRMLRGRKRLRGKGWKGMHSLTAHLRAPTGCDNQSEACTGSGQGVHSCAE